MTESRSNPRDELFEKERFREGIDGAQPERAQTIRQLGPRGEDEDWRAASVADRFEDLEPCSLGRV